MLKGLELIQIIILFVGITANVSFFMLFFFIPQVNHGPGLKFIVYNLITNIIEIEFIIIDPQTESSGTIVSLLIVCSY